MKMLFSRLYMPLSVCFRVLVAQLDINDDTSVKDVTSKIVAKKGRIDVLVNNAGYDLFSPIEDVTLNQAKEQCETNFFGVVRLA